MRKVLIAVFSVAVLVGAAMAGAFDTPYTFGMKIVAPLMQSGSLAIVQPSGAVSKVLSVTTGGVEKFSVSADGAMAGLSAADCETLTPRAEGQLCYSTASNVLNVSTSVNAGGFAPLH